MPLHEVVLCATTSSGPNTGPGAIFLHDIQTGTSLASFKQTNAGVHCTDFVQSNNIQGGFMLAAQPDKSILNVYNFQKVFVFYSLSVSHNGARTP
jgi:pre-rRNA-processing protein IPI3